MVEKWAEAALLEAEARRSSLDPLDPAFAIRYSAASESVKWLRFLTDGSLLAQSEIYADTNGK